MVRRTWETALLDWLTAPATDADRIRLARLLASGRADAVIAALGHLAEHRAAGELLTSWQRAACDVLTLCSAKQLRTTCLTEAARLHGDLLARRPVSGFDHRPVLAAGIRRYGPPPRLQGAKGKTVRWRHVPSAH